MNTKTKTIVKIWSLVLLICGILQACKDDAVTYTGPDLVQFADTMVVLPVMDSETYHEIYISSSQTVNYDRNFGVEVVATKSNAQEGYHFDLESTTVTIKAGERVAALKIRGYEDKIAESDSLALTLHLLNVDDQFGLKGTVSHVILQRVCPFDINNFLGPCILESQFLNSYTMQDLRLLETVQDPENAMGIIIKDYFQDGYDLKVRFNNEDPVNPVLEMEDGQTVGRGSDFFGYIYGDDILRIAQPNNYVSSFNSCEGYIVQYSTIYVEEVGEVGTYTTVVNWITEAEADYLRRQGY